MKFLLLLLGLAGALSASPMTIFFTGTGSGTLDGVPFGPSEFNILATANTGDVVTGAGFARVNHLTAQIEVAGGLYSFTVPTSTIILNGSSQAIFAYQPPGTHLIAGYNAPALATYALDSNIGVNDASIGLLQWASVPAEPVMTNGGRLIFNDATGISGSFSVAIGGDGPPPGTAVPEPGTWVLSAGGFAVLLWLRRSRT